MLQPQQSDSQWVEPEARQATGAVAPVWHTVLLMMGIALLSIAGAEQFGGAHPQVDRMQTYAFTAGTELLMLGWVLLGLKLRRISFRSLLGSVPGSFRAIAIDMGFALAFWIGSLMVLANIGVFWTVIEAAIKHQALFTPGKHLGPDASQLQTLHTLTELAPASASEMAAWVGLCIVAGIAEEVVFRGYLHRQFTAWARGTVAAGVVVSALMFGLAHGYQGVRNMVMLSIFGVLFSLLALFRRSLRPGMIAHAWQDLFAGLALAFAHAHHWL